MKTVGKILDERGLVMFDFIAVWWRWCSRGDGSCEQEK